jgi:hypothetical protein
MTNASTFCTVDLGEDKKSGFLPFPGLPPLKESLSEAPGEMTEQK